MRSTVVTEQDVQRDILQILKDEARPRSLLVAYALWLFLFWAGAHRFYLGRPRSGVTMLLCSVVTLGVGGLIWACVDAFLIPGMHAERNVRFIEPRWMRVQPLGVPAPSDAEPLRGEPRPAHSGRPMLSSLLDDAEDLPPVRLSRPRLPAVAVDEPHFVYPSSPPFLRRPANATAPWATV